MIKETDEQYLEELFSLPFKTSLVAKLDNMKLYSSEGTRKKFLTTMINNSKFKPVKNHLEKLINKGRIVPCWTHKGLFSFIGFKIFTSSESEEKNNMAFFAPSVGKVFITFDNNVNFIGLAKDNWLASLTMHECMHMASFQLKNKFISTFKQEYLSYYRFYWKKVFEIPDNKNVDKEVLNCLLFLFKTFEWQKTNLSFSKIVHGYYKQLYHFKKYSNLDEEQFKNRVIDYLEFIKSYFFNFNTFTNNLRENTLFFKTMYDSYKHLKLKNTNSLCIQELFFPSEMICVLSETSTINSKIHKIFRGIK